MAQTIFVNLPVVNVDRSTAFYEAVGATADPRFAQAGAAAMVSFSDEVVFMLLSHARFTDFTSKRIVDAKTEAQVLLCLSRQDAAAVDATVERAVAAGGMADPTPRQEMSDFMYGRSFEDPDGHVVELVWMDVEKAMAAWGDTAAIEPEPVS